MSEAEDDKAADEAALKEMGLPPGDDDSPDYEATKFVRGPARGGYIWFACKDRSRDRVLPVVNLREMMPGDIDGGTASLYFSGMVVVLEGKGMRSVVHRLFFGRCSSIHEIRPRQKPKRDDEPIVERITFLVPPKPDADKKDDDDKTPPPRSRN